MLVFRGVQLKIVVFVSIVMFFLGGCNCDTNLVPLIWTILMKLWKKYGKLVGIVIYSVPKCVKSVQTKDLFSQQSDQPFFQSSLPSPFSWKGTFQPTHLKNMIVNFDK